jgi:steroid delta-isomerase
MSNKVRQFPKGEPVAGETPPGAEAYCAFLETVTPETLPNLRSLMTGDVHFRDPFNDVNGADKMIAIFEDMFDSIGPCTFKIHERTGDAQHCFITWTLTGTLFGKPWRADGASELRFDATGLLREHIDYWDAAQGVYEHFPVLGPILRMLRRRLAT